jgi:Mrp family chromosome partitioning ATPase
MIGVALAIGGLAVKAIFDSDAMTARPEAPSDVEAATSLSGAENSGVDSLDENPLIASLPAIMPRRGLRSLNMAEAHTEVWRRPTSSYALEVERIYERLSRSRERPNPMSVLIAGTTPQCGASTFAANLARTAAARGKRVLLIDAHRGHPTLALTIGADTPKTLIKLANRWRPLFRLQPYGQSLNLIPSLDNENRVCREIADESDYQRIDGISGNFDFVVLDGPDLSELSELKALVPAANKILLVVPDDAEHVAQSTRLMRRLSAPPEKFEGYVGSTLVHVDEAA